MFFKIHVFVHAPPDIVESLHSDQRHAPPEIVEFIVPMCMRPMESQVYGNFKWCRNHTSTEKQKCYLARLRVHSRTTRKTGLQTRNLTMLAPSKSTHLVGTVRMDNCCSAALRLGVVLPHLSVVN